MNNDSFQIHVPSLNQLFVSLVIVDRIQQSVMQMESASVKTNIMVKSAEIETVRYHIGHRGLPVHGAVMPTHKKELEQLLFSR